MKRVKTTTFALVLCGQTLHAGPIEDAENAATLLDQAKQELALAEAKPERINALTQTIVALEKGMAAVRKGQRNAARREAILRQKIATREMEISATLNTLQTLQGAPQPALLLHPMGPTGTARSAMILSELAPALQAEIELLKIDLKEIGDLAEVQKKSQQILQSSLSEVQNARTVLSQSISSRTDAPIKFIEDSTKTALLLATSKTLDQFAAQLRELDANAPSEQIETTEQLPTTLEPPVIGRVLRKFNEIDAAGVKRPGIILVTEPNAIVTAPFAATVRYQGPLLDYGQVIILEPHQNYLFIMAGLGQIFAETGEVVIEGAPLGLMSQDIGGSTLAQDTLYIEVRENQIPVDPLNWFNATQG